MIAIGIMGGTFNPIHNGHIQIAKAAYEQYNLHEVWFMPNHIPGYKEHNDLLDGEMRLKMVSLAIKDIPFFKTSDYEIKRNGNTYTAETMQLLTEQYPNAQFYFIIGADSLDTFEKWKKPEVILQHCKILVAPREGISENSLQKQIHLLHEKYGDDHFYQIHCEKMNCASSSIRKDLAVLVSHANEELSLFELSKQLCMPYTVLQYIKENHLYL